MSDTTNHTEHDHQFPEDEQCWRIICAITYFGGGSKHVHCEEDTCGKVKVIEHEEKVPRLQF